ncbi:hypothetical protein [uncultured Microbacterium sp.]|uniref:hypothetical protein n=1 Tax=uncultured Microbacterium sp. TaxID=191216 RepID=UPI0028DD3664|nr:hypothetical protein [uncultured Microbacterium sp.]
MQRTWVRELAGWMLALAVAVITVGAVASSARAELLFRDGDSLIVALLSRSLLDGGHQDWAMSSVLFLPETAVFTTLDALLPLDVDGLLALSGVLNMVALYGALRLVAGRRRAGAAPVGWAVAALCVVGVLAMTETSASRDALELASLPLTTTYYSATVIGTVLAVGIVRRMLDHGRPRPMLLAGLLVVTGVSTLSNPLFVAWAVVPIGVLLVVSAVRRRGAAPVARSTAGAALAALAAGTAIGFASRIPFSAWIANTGAGYAQPERWRESLVYYGGLLGDRLGSPLGVLAAAIIAALLGWAVVRSIRSHDAAARFVAGAAWLAPLLVVVGAIALGTHAARYLQPLAFAPVLALVAHPRVLRLAPNLRRQAIAAIAVVLVLGAGLSMPRAIAAASRPDADLACVTDWVEASGHTGAGQFWTVRLPKLHLADPSRLVQVDHRLNGYAWLVNRADLSAAEVSFLIEDAQTVQWQLPVSAIPDDVVDCGRYRILDFGDALLPLGPAHS